MTTILLAGFRGAGKSTVARLLERAGLSQLNVGDLLKERLQEEGIECRSRLEIGKTFLARHPEQDIFRVVKESPWALEVSVFDGVRLAITCHQFKAHDPGTHIWYLEADRALREQRLKNLSEAREQLQGPDYEPQQLIIRSLANSILVNNGSLAELRAKVRRFLRQRAE